MSKGLSNILLLPEPKKVLALASSVYLLACAANAQEVWDGGGSDGDWTTDLNWVDNTAPVSSNTLHIQFSGSTRRNNNLDTDYTLNKLEYTGTTANFSTGSGSSSTLFFDGTSAEIIQNTTNNHTLSSLLELNADTTISINSTGSLEFNNTITLNTNRLTISGAGTGTVTINGQIDGSGGTIQIDTGTTLSIPYQKISQNDIGIELNGGRFHTIKDRMGTLTLSDNSILDVGTAGGTNENFFKDFAHNSGTLSIYNWTSGNDHIYFDSDIGFNPTYIELYSDEGITEVAPDVGLIWKSTKNAYELVPIPEAKNLAALFMIGTALLYRSRKRFGIR